MSFDVTVVGSRVAGASTAMLLARSARRVLVEATRGNGAQVREKYVVADLVWERRSA